MTDKPEQNTDGKTGEKTVTETGPRRRRRFSNDESDTTPPQAAETSETGDNWAEKDRGGYFSGRPGPGRGHTTDGAGAWDTGAGGEGGSDLDLLKEMVAAIERRGPRWFDELLKASPVTSAQLLAALRKSEPQPGTPGGGAVRIELGENLAGIAASIMTPRTPDDVDTLDLDTARGEVGRLRAEVERLQRTINDQPAPKPKADAKIVPEQEGEPVRCTQCWRLFGRRTMIPVGGKCTCGTTWYEAKDGREAPMPPDENERPLNATAFSIGPGDGGWKQVGELSAAGIRNALGTGGPDRGPFE